MNPFNRYQYHFSGAPSTRHLLIRDLPSPCFKGAAISEVNDCAVKTTCASHHDDDDDDDGDSFDRRKYTGNCPHTCALSLHSTAARTSSVHDWPALLPIWPRGRPLCSPFKADEHILLVSESQFNLAPLTGQLFYDNIDDCVSPPLDVASTWSRASRLSVSFVRSFPPHRRQCQLQLVLCCPMDSPPLCGSD